MAIKSNPPGVDGGLKGLKMSDYKVDYDNHPLFMTGSSGRKQGSPIRIFTNIPLNILELPAADGYKHCKRCNKWVSAENKHCKLCKACTSKDGRRYRHCKMCARCVKPTWKHCKTCERCVLEKHECGLKPKIFGNCFTCNEPGHTQKECPNGEAEVSPKVTLKKKKLTNGLNKKRITQKASPNVEVILPKRAIKRETNDAAASLNKKVQKVSNGTGPLAKKRKVATEGNKLLKNPQGQKKQIKKKTQVANC